MRRPTALPFGLLAILTASAAASGDDAPPSIAAYRVVVDGQLKFTIDRGGSTTRRVQAEVDYRNARRAGGVDVAVDRFLMRATVDGQPIDSVEVSRSRLASRRPDRQVDLRREDAPPALQPIFAQFDPPLVSIELDAEGGELSRKGKGPDQEKESEPDPDREMAQAQVNAQGAPIGRGPTAPLMGAHMVDLTRLFHPKFPEGESQWESPVILPFGRGQVAKGVLRYKKAGEAKDGLVPVDVTGYLKVSGTHDLARIDQGAYKVAGKQTYDTNARSWSSGRLTVAIGWDARLPNGVILHAGGPATYTFSRREAASATPKAKGARKKS